MSESTDIRYGDSSAEIPPSVRFDDREQRQESMSSFVDSYLDSIVAAGNTMAPDGVEDWATDWLAVQARFPYRSWRNTLLLSSQYPKATLIRAYDNWAESYATVASQEQAIWLWKPVVKKQCPKCGNSLGYHQSGKVPCDYHEDSAVDYWSTGVVGTRPAPYFDISQLSVEPAGGVDEDSPVDQLTPRGVRNVFAELAEQCGYQVIEKPYSEIPGEGPGYLGSDSFNFQPQLVLQDGRAAEQAGVLLQLYLEALASDGSVEVIESETSARNIAVGLIEELGLPGVQVKPDIVGLGSSREGVATALSEISTGFGTVSRKLEQATVEMRSSFSDSSV